VDFSSVGYGREKGNSQLAVVEETGLIGLAFYGVFLFTMFGEFFSSLWRLPPGETKLELALTAGLLAGLLAQSCFEAWWTSPGSVGSALFWTTAGVGFGLMRKASLVRPPVRTRYLARTALRSPVRYES
jgi:O-antigen ligase